MQIRCYSCKMPISIGRASVNQALNIVHEDDLVYYDFNCPNCRKSNRVSKKQLLHASPTWEYQPTEKPVDKKTDPKKEAEAKSLDKKTPAKKTPAAKAPAKKAPAKKTPAAKAPAKKTPAKKRPANKAPAKKDTKKE